MPRNEVRWICDVCKHLDCGGGCYYTPRRIVAKLEQLPGLAQLVTNPGSYRRSSKRAEANPMEGNWAIRADIHRALDHVAQAVPNGPTVRQVLVLAHIGVPVPGRAGEWAGCSDSSIARLLGLDERTVAAYRRRGLRLMVECLNPNYKFEEGE